MLFRSKLLIKNAIGGGSSEAPAPEEVPAEEPAPEEPIKENKKMKQINEIRRMQQIAGILKENENLPYYSKKNKKEFSRDYFNDHGTYPSDDDYLNAFDTLNDDDKKWYKEFLRTIDHMSTNDADNEILFDTVDSISPEDIIIGYKRENRMDPRDAAYEFARNYIEIEKPIRHPF